MANKKPWLKPQRRSGEQETIAGGTSHGQKQQKASSYSFFIIQTSKDFTITPLNLLHGLHNNLRATDDASWVPMRN